MSDDLDITQPQDPTKINMKESWEVRYWTRKFGVTEKELQAAVDAVGTTSAAVAWHLGKAL